MKSIPFPFLFFILSAVLFHGCRKADPVIPNEEELITTLTYVLTPVAGGDVISLQFSDPDGDGGTAPVFLTDPLQANTTYSGELVLLNETEDPAGNISAEVAQEGEDHQFFFNISLADITLTYADQDNNGNPIGLSTTLTTGDVGSGTLTITLRHEPEKGASGVASGDITNAGGETDIEVTFEIDVE